MLAAGGGDVRACLAEVLGRSELRIAYWLPDAERWVDRDGGRQEVDPSQPGVTLVSHGGRCVAALLLDSPGPDLADPLLAAVGLGLETERLRLELHARLDEQRALRRVATAVARQHEPQEVLELVAREVAHHLGADAALTACYDGPGLATVLAEWSAPGVNHFPAGRQIEISGATALAQVQRTGSPARVDSYAGMPGEYPAEVRRLGMRAGIAAPIVVDGELWGAVAAGSVGAPFTGDTEARLGAFAELVAQAIANVDARLKLHESRARIVHAADDARRRIERDLHDGAQQRLVALAMSLGVVARNADPATAAAVKACGRELQTALGELRELARGIHPVVLTERGLAAAVRELAARSPVPVAIDVHLEGRLPPAQEAALYFVAAEALTNVAKYAGAGAAHVSLHRRDGWAEIAIADDGVGEPPHARAAACAASPIGSKRCADGSPSRASRGGERPFARVYPPAVVHKCERVQRCSCILLLVTETPSIPHPLPTPLVVLIAQRFRVIGEPMRIRVLDALRDGPLTINELTEVLGASQQNVSRHVVVLAQAGIVAREKDGTRVRCSIADETIFELCEIVCGGLRQQVAELGEVLSGGPAS
jgi:signal transduction histidine kinase/DNA-binding transcriptional ArsR family regulator